jgi:hypothetical protein
MEMRPKRVTKTCVCCGAKFRDVEESGRKYCDDCNYYRMFHLIAYGSLDDGVKCPVHKAKEVS